MIPTLIKFRSKFNYEFYNHRKKAFVMSSILIFAALFCIFYKNLNFGIDFVGGIMIDAKFSNNPDLNQIRNDLDLLPIGNFEIQEFGAKDNILIKIEKKRNVSDDEQVTVIDLVKNSLPSDVDYRRIEFVGPKVGKELKILGLKAVLFSLLSMFIYIWFRFSGWQFGLGAVIALFHDVISTIGFYSITQIEFNLSSIAAILTIAGYSINDTVVVFDRIRENIRKVEEVKFNKILNISINETLSRTIMTSVTTLIALLALFILGGEVIKGFILSLIWGVLIGTYSSIFIASPLIAFLGYKDFGKKN